MVYWHLHDGSQIVRIHDSVVRVCRGEPKHIQHRTRAGTACARIAVHVHTIYTYIPRAYREEFFFAFCRGHCLVHDCLVSLLRCRQMVWCFRDTVRGDVETLACDVYRGRRGKQGGNGQQHRQHHESAELWVVCEYRD